MSKPAKPHLASTLSLIILFQILTENGRVPKPELQAEFLGRQCGKYVTRSALFVHVLPWLCRSRQMRLAYQPPMLILTGVQHRKDAEHCQANVSEPFRCFEGNFAKRGPIGAAVAIQYWQVPFTSFCASTSTAVQNYILGFLHFKCLVQGAKNKPGYEFDAPA